MKFNLFIFSYQLDILVCSTFLTTLAIQQRDNSSISHLTFLLSLKLSSSIFILDLISQKKLYLLNSAFNFACNASLQTIQFQYMKVKINKLLPYNQQNKKLKLAPITIDQRNYFISPFNVEQKNYVGCFIQLHFICNMPDINSDYEYLRCEVKIQSSEAKGILEQKIYSFEGIKRGEGKREFILEFIPILRGSYGIILDLNYKQKYFIQSSQPPQQKKDSLRANIICEDPYQVDQKIVYEEKPATISFPLFVQYTISNKLKENLELQISFISEFFDYKFLNSNMIRISGGDSYYLMLQVEQKSEKDKRQLIFGEKGLMIGTLWLQQGKSRFEKKLFIKQGFKHLLFKGQTIDKKVVKKDIVDVKIKFTNIYEINYKIGSIRIGIDEKQIPAGIKLLKISRDRIDLCNNTSQIITLTMICLRSGLFHLKGIDLNIKDKNNPTQQRILKYINQLYLIVENQKDEKKDIIMQKTAEIEIDSLI